MLENKLNFDSLIELIEKRRNKDSFFDISFPFKSFNEELPSIERGCYYLIGGETGTGKTAFADDVFLFNSYDQLKEKVDFLYFSFEISKERKLLKGLCRKIFLDTGILIDSKYVLSNGELKISDEHLELIKKYKPYVEEFSKRIEIYDIKLPKSTIKNIVFNKLKTLGKLEVSQGSIVKFEPHDPTKYLFLFLDHNSLVKNDDGLSKKQIIDDLSSFFLEIRNKANVTIINIQQFNRSIQNSDRVNIDRLRPQTSDFRETSVTQDDANVIIGLFNPFKYKISQIGEVNIEELADRQRLVFLLKNRDGNSDIFWMLGFIGECGNFMDLDSPTKESFYEQVEFLKNLKKSYNANSNLRN